MFQGIKVVNLLKNKTKTKQPDSPTPHHAPPGPAAFFPPSPSCPGPAADTQHCVLQRSLSRDWQALGFLTLLLINCVVCAKYLNSFH